jgi:hypothetical protein
LVAILFENGDIYVHRHEAKTGQWQSQKVIRRFEGTVTALAVTHTLQAYAMVANKGIIQLTIDRDEPWLWNVDAVQGISSVLPQ